MFHLLITIENLKPSLTEITTDTSHHLFLQYCNTIGTELINDDSIPYFIWSPPPYICTSLSSEDQL